MSDRNAHLVTDSESPWPVPPAYVSPWPVERLAALINAIPQDDCCKGMARLLLDIVREADRLLAKAQFDNWTLEGLLRDRNDASQTVLGK